MQGAGQELDGARRGDQLVHREVRVSRIPQARLNRRRYHGGPDWYDYQLTPHFKFGELIHDQGAAPPWETMNMCRGFCIAILEPLRDAYGPCVVVSGHRTPERNRQVGGAANSWHVWEWHPGEMGVDVVFQRGNPHVWFTDALKGKAGGVGRYARHLHVDSRPERVSWTSDAA